MATYDPNLLNKIVADLADTLSALEDSFIKFYIDTANVNASLDSFSQKLSETTNKLDFEVPQINFDALQTSIDDFSNKLNNVAVVIDTNPLVNSFNRLQAEIDTTTQKLGAFGSMPNIDLKAITDAFDTLTNITTNQSSILNTALADLIRSVMNASLNINNNTNSNPNNNNNNNNNRNQKVPIPKTIAELEKFIKNLNATITPFNTTRKSIFEFANNLRFASNSAENAGTFFGSIGDRIGAFIQRFSGLLTVGGLAVKAFSVAVNATIKVFSGFVSTITSSLSALKTIPAAILPFVEAFNPQLVEAFKMVISDLMAVIGAGLQPVLEAFMIIIRAVADSLVPIVQKLAPAFQMAAEGIIRFFVPILDALFNIFNQLIPVINQLVPVFAQLAGTFGEIIGVLLTALTPTIIQLANMFLSLAEFMVPVLEAVLGWLQSFPYLEEVMASLAGILIAYLIPSFIALAVEVIAIAAPFAALVAIVLVVVTAFKKLSEWLFGTNEEGKKQKEQQAKQVQQQNAFGTTQASVGATARKAEYSSVENLSKNLIKSAFSGSGNDKLRSIDNRMKELVDINRQQLNLEKVKPKEKVRDANEKVPGRN